MYDFKLNKNEEIKLISDDTIVYTGDNPKNVSCIITNKRLMILDYPSCFHNSAEDLRISGKFNYIRKKEIVGEVNLSNILSINKEDKYYTIRLKDERYINLDDNIIIDYLNKNIIN